MVGLGVIKPNVMATEIEDALDPQPVWTPSHPRKDVILLPQLQVSPPWAFNPFLNMEFGGLHGERLAHLVKITAYINEDSSTAIGLSFYFDHKKAILFGNKSKKWISTPVDGPGDERISGIKFEKQEEHALSVQVCTRIRFGPLLPKMDIPLRPKNWVPEPNTLEPPDGQYITGFTAILAAHTYDFQSLGLQCEQLKSPLVDLKASLKEVKKIYLSGSDPN
ncbi:hypothetical protein BJY01DRAFT_116469 [Aspergillus pseudoustus]|uniref:Uncharacterized protein n=1 Tax=Aspergillus pseudoustus TaxID=1810923 RepID=A0ABR4L029_9EURO